MSISIATLSLHGLETATAAYLLLRNGEASVIDLGYLGSLCGAGEERFAYNIPALVEKGVLQIVRVGNMRYIARGRNSLVRLASQHVGFGKSDNEYYAVLPRLTDLKVTPGCAIDLVLELASIRQMARERIVSAATATIPIEAPDFAAQVFSKETTQAAIAAYLLLKQRQITRIRWSSFEKVCGVSAGSFTDHLSLLSQKGIICIDGADGVSYGEHCVIQVGQRFEVLPDLLSSIVVKRDVPFNLVSLADQVKRQLTEEGMLDYVRERALTAAPTTEPVFTSQGIEEEMGRRDRQGNRTSDKGRRHQPSHDRTARIPVRTASPAKQIETSVHNSADTAAIQQPATVTAAEEEKRAMKVPPTTGNYRPQPVTGHDDDPKVVEFPPSPLEMLLVVLRHLTLDEDRPIPLKEEGALWGNAYNSPYNMSQFAKYNIIPTQGVVSNRLRRPVEYIRLRHREEGFFFNFLIIEPGKVYAVRDLLLIMAWRELAKTGNVTGVITLEEVQEAIKEDAQPPSELSTDGETGGDVQAAITVVREPSDDLAQEEQSQEVQHQAAPTDTTIEVTSDIEVETPDQEVSENETSAPSTEVQSEEAESGDVSADTAETLSDDTEHQQDEAATEDPEDSQARLDLTDEEQLPDPMPVLATPSPEPTVVEETDPEDGSGDGVVAGEQSERRVLYPGGIIQMDEDTMLLLLLNKKLETSQGEAARLRESAAEHRRAAEQDEAEAARLEEGIPDFTRLIDRLNPSPVTDSE